MRRDEVDEIKRDYPPGTRIELVEMDGEARMPSGLKGSVSMIDDAGQIHMKWENGSSLALVPGVDSFQKLPEAERVPKQSKTERYIEQLNAHILPLIDYSELQNSYETDMEYAKGVLNRLHEAMVEVYGSETLNEENVDEDGFVVVPGVVRGMESEKICLALLELDLSSSGEHWGTNYLCKYGVVSQSGELPELKARVADGQKHVTLTMNNAFVPYEYGYTAKILGDIHVRKSALPKEIQDILNDFQNHSAELLFEDDEDEPEM
jgi:hypothetical protein